MRPLSPLTVVKLMTWSPRALSGTLAELVHAAGRGGALLLARGVTFWYGREGDADDART